MEEKPEINEKGNRQIPKRLTRREFIRLGLAAALSTSIPVTNSLLGERVARSELESPLIAGSLARYQIAWDAKPWVWINLAEASEFLNSTVIKPGGTFSLIDSLRFDKMSGVSRENQNPALGYISAQMSNFNRLSGWGYGLCLASTTIFRAALQSPLQVLETTTHYEAYPDYFDQKWQLGTDAAVFNPDPGDLAPRVDLRLRNPTNSPIHLSYSVFDFSGNILKPPRQEISDAIYKASFLDHLTRVLRRMAKQKFEVNIPYQYVPQYTFGNKRIFSVAEIFSSDPVDFSFEISRSKAIPGDTNGNVTFSRRLIVNSPSTETKQFTEHYRSRYKPPENSSQG